VPSGPLDPDPPTLHVALIAKQLKTNNLLVYFSGM
jgi:hypothetical protein